MLVPPTTLAAAAALTPRRASAAPSARYGTSADQWACVRIDALASAELAEMAPARMRLCLERALSSGVVRSSRAREGNAAGSEWTSEGSAGGEPPVPALPVPALPVPAPPVPAVGEATSGAAAVRGGMGESEQKRTRKACGTRVGCCRSARVHRVGALSMRISPPRTIFSDAFLRESV